MIAITEKSRSAVLALTRVLSGLARPPAVAHRMEHGVDTPGTWAMTGERRRQSYLTPAVETSLAGLGSRVAELARRARKIGAEPIVVTQRSMFWRRRDGRIEGVREWAPDRFSPALAGLGALTGVDRHYLERLQAEAILAACRAANGICLDLAAELAPDPATDFYDGFHTTPAGADRIARYLHARLGGLR